MSNIKSTVPLGWGWDVEKASLVLPPWGAKTHTEKIKLHMLIESLGMTPKLVSR